MRDGVRLSGWLHAPLGTEEVPGILIANGYGAEVEPFLEKTISLLARHDYLVLCVRMRGLSPSEGKAGLYEGFGPDTHDLIEWLAEQPRCNGRVGMFGGSLLGLVQYLGAREAPPSLKVILPDDAGADNYWTLWHPGGMSAGPGRAARQLVSGAVQEYSLAIAHPDFDEFWRKRTVQAEDLEAIAQRGIAVFLTSGWDSYLLGSAKSYEWLKAGPRGRRKMFIGPWGHNAFMSPEASSMEPPVLPYSGFEYGVMWLNRWLKDIANGVDEERPVLIYVQGPNEWRFEEEWPLPDERRMRLYLCERKSGTRGGLNDGSLSRQRSHAGGSATYQYSPEGPYNIAAVSAISRPWFDKTPYEMHGLAWTSAPLEVATEMTGYPQMTFWSALSEGDTDFVAEITDVSVEPSSERTLSLQVTRGYLNAMRFFSRSKPLPLVPGRPYRFVIELYPTAYVFPAGHRIRITLQGSAIDPGPPASLTDTSLMAGGEQNGRSIQQGPGLNRQACCVRVFHGQDFPSFVDLPIIGQGELR